MQPINVLLIEADSDLSETVVEVLADAAIRVTAKSSRRGALEWLSHNRLSPPAVIVCDLPPPVTDADFLVTLRSLAGTEHVPIVATSGAKLPAEIIALFSRVVWKPYEIDELRAAILELAASRSAR